MAEPVSTSATAATTVGLMALLIGAMGNVAADVTMVVVSALAGCFIALSAMKNQGIIRSITFIIIAVMVALVTSWAISEFIYSMSPSLKSPYLPSIIALFIGFLSNKLPNIMDDIFRKFGNKVGVKTK